jgi:hypothetical protein
VLVRNVVSRQVSEGIEASTLCLLPGGGQRLNTGKFSSIYIDCVQTAQPGTQEHACTVQHLKQLTPPAHLIEGEQARQVLNVPDLRGPLGSVHTNERGQGQNLRCRADEV